MCSNDNYNHVNQFQNGRGRNQLVSSAIQPVVNSEPHTGARPSVRLCVGLTTYVELELELIQTQMAQKLMHREGVYVLALRGSKNVKGAKNFRWCCRNNIKIRFDFQSFVCVETPSTSELSKSVVFMPPYNDSRATHGKPCKLTALRVANEIKVACSCPDSRRGTKYTCWHERTVKLPGVLSALVTAALVNCDPLTGSAERDVIPFSL
jgi:hypothetical protein